MAKKKVKAPFLYDYDEEYGEEWTNPDDLEAPWRLLNTIGAEKSFDLEKVYREGNKSYHSRGVSMVRGKNGYAKIAWYWGCVEMRCDYMEVEFFFRNYKGRGWAHYRRYKDVCCLDSFSEAVGKMYAMLEDMYDEAIAGIEEKLKVA